MKQREKCSRREFESRQVHQKKTDTVYNVRHGVKHTVRTYESEFSFLLMGLLR